MESNIDLSSGGLQCDNVNCDFIDHSIPSADYDNWINRPCPKCGENLLTLEDFLNVRLLEKQVAWINSLTKEQIDELAKHVDIKAIPFMADLKEEDLDKTMSVQIDTHKGITFKNLVVLGDGDPE